MTSITYGKVTRGKPTKGGLLESGAAEIVADAITAARAIDGARNSAFPNGPTTSIGNAALGAYSWAALAEGNDLIIHTDGTNDFGSGPDQSKILYDEFDGGTDGADIDLTTTQGESWDSFATNTPKYEALSPHSGSFAMRCIDADLRRAVNKAFATPVTEVFVAYAIRTPDGSFFPHSIEEESLTAAVSNSVIKVVWMLGPGESTVLSDMVIPSRKDAADFSLGGNNLTYSLDPALEDADWQWDTGANNGGWNYWSCWLQADPTNPKTVNGKGWFQAIPEGVVGGQVINENNAQPIFEGSDETEADADWHSMSVIAWHRVQWDRADQAWQFDDSGGTFVDQTDESNGVVGGDAQPFPTGAGADDYFAIGQQLKFDEISIDIGTSGAGTYTLTWEYWNGSAWAALSGVTDNSNSFKASTGVHLVTFTVPGDWAATTLNGSASLFYVRARRDSGTVDTDPTLDNVDPTDRANKDKTNMDIDSFYMAWGENANARIVLADNATFTSATRATVSPHTSWSTTRIKDSLRKASHSGLSGLHIHLVKADNTRIYVGQLG